MGIKFQYSTANGFSANEFPRSAPHLNLPAGAVVADFIDERNQWKDDRIAQCFSKEVAEKILRVPLPRTAQQDKLIWRFDKDGKYSIKSGCQLAVKMKFLDSPGCSDRSKTQWKVIWSNEILEKMKIFMWRAAQNLLPTSDSLWKKKVVMSPVCQRCCCKSEDVFHALIDCKAACKV